MSRAPHAAELRQSPTSLIYSRHFSGPENWMLAHLGNLDGLNADEFSVQHRVAILK
jgi:hypothetical protein